MTRALLPSICLAITLAGTAQAEGMLGRAGQFAGQAYQSSSAAIGNGAKMVTGSVGSLVEGRRTIRPVADPFANRGMAVPSTAVAQPSIYTPPNGEVSPYIASGMTPRMPHPWQNNQAPYSAQTGGPVVEIYPGQQNVTIGTSHASNDGGVLARVGNSISTATRNTGERISKWNPFHVLSPRP